ncbi:ketoacyl-ACP synthase III [Streptomyces sp. ISL-12]|uniref:3-oxoacyl-ACP synthase III family protein n=1 Tax=Streptomyces sp. ISL-12 TaxID=2819177 RepID=UPI001BEC9420|nr:ketoacyl-ACP synthase III [Streptomyces sp. ISL-12]MBT2413698.1 ketoacyl-ACP synthase III [Streptomyces sp. ISL-12]
MAIGITRLGAYVPPDIVDNATVAAWSGTTPEWIHERTGIDGRRYAAPGTDTSDLAVAAALDLLGADRARWPRIGSVIVATSTGDRPQPATAAALQHKLRLPGSPASFDVNAVCCGFLFALAIADGLLRHRTPDGSALVVGADMYSRITNRSDRRTVSLFGDGAGAALVGPVPDGFGLHASRLVTDGDLRGLVEVPAGGTAKALDQEAYAAGEHLFRMDGRAVRDYVLTTLPKLVGEVLDESGLTLDDIDRVVFHQANTRLLEQCSRDLGLDPARVPLTAPRYGNTGAASIPVTLHDAHLRQPLRRGERVLLAGVGGGMSAGAAVMTWY